MEEEKVVRIIFFSLLFFFFLGSRSRHLFRERNQYFSRKILLVSFLSFSLLLLFFFVFFFCFVFSTSFFLFPLLRFYCSLFENWLAGLSVPSCVRPLNDAAHQFELAFDWKMERTSGSAVLFLKQKIAVQLYRKWIRNERVAHKPATVTHKNGGIEIQKSHHILLHFHSISVDIKRQRRNSNNYLKRLPNKLTIIYTTYRGGGREL